MVAATISTYSPSSGLVLVDALISRIEETSDRLKRRRSISRLEWTAGTVAFRCVIVPPLDFARALNVFASDVPESGQNAIRSAVSRHLLLLGHLEQSIGVMEMIQDPIRRADAKIQWIGAKQ